MGGKFTFDRAVAHGIVKQSPDDPHRPSVFENDDLLVGYSFSDCPVSY